MGSYSQLTYHQRYHINALLKAGWNQTEIAESIGVHKSTISRELKRNRGKRGYRSKQADQLANTRRYKAKSRITDGDWEMIEELISLDWSPEQISEYCREEQELPISHEWIYQYIYRDKHNGGRLWKHLRCRRKRRKRYGSYEKRGQIPNRRWIDERPQAVEDRSRLGDWEADTIIGKGRKGAIVTLVDRKSRFLRMGMVRQRTKEAVKEMIISLLADFPVHTITCDNGKEFTDHEGIAKALGAKVYFAHPYASWERGTNENTNGLIRQYIPKDTRFGDLTCADMIFVENRLNTRPRKCLSFATPMVFLNNHGCT
ncbi:MAG: IS30 family transposase [Anaerolineales bacterium]|uniref:IS30 family transposase n=1 Tax=Candidatus Desulfolinea nitratireducens TaxID=2841698 RepID=A0A8J6NID1_9CHLR|nr:IS30 family transposase [Candidatus Desulfolinea nitratireducens]